MCSVLFVCIVAQEYTLQMTALDLSADFWSEKVEIRIWG